MNPQANVFDISSCRKDEMMFSLSKRQVEIMLFLLKERKMVSTQKIADAFGVSRRTIRYDLDLVEEWCAKNQATLVRSPGKGVRLETAIQRNQLERQLRNLSPQDRILTEEERVRLILQELIASGRPMTLDHLSQRIQCSRNTVIKMMKIVRVRLEECNLELRIVTGKGYQVAGNESVIRRLLFDLYAERVDWRKLAEFFTKKNQQLPSYLAQWFEDDEIDQVFSILMEAEEIFSHPIADVAFINLTIHILVAMERIRIGAEIELPDTQVVNTSEMKIADWIVKKIRADFGLEMSPTETETIAMHLLGAKLFRRIDELSETVVQTQDDTKNWVEEIIRYFEEETGLQLMDDQQLHQSLMLHMKTAMNRFRRGRVAKNPYLQEIKNKYPFVFQMAKQSVQGLENHLGRMIDEDEIGYIALHLRVAYERNAGRGTQITALVICASGIATSEFLKMRLESLLPELTVIDTCSVQDYEIYKDQIHFVISTLDYELPGVDVIHVSPFLDNEELMKIREHMIQAAKFRQISDMTAPSKSENGGKEIMLKDVLHADVVRLNVEASDWEMAIREAGTLLVAQKSIEPAYIDNMITAIHDLGPYIVIMPHVAFAHARPDETVNESCMSVITLKEPVEFGSEANDPVSIVFAFAAETGASHMKALQDLAKFLSKPENLTFLMECEDKDLALNKLLEY